MNLNFKLYFKYILLGISQFFLKHLLRQDKNTTILLNQRHFYYLSLHFKLSSLFYSTQLVDMLAYEIPLSSNFNILDDNFLKQTKIPNSCNTILVYNFHSIFFQQRFFVFVINHVYNNTKKNSINWTPVTSTSELFLNANWLEREISELHGIFFTGKKDLRNLLLQYGDTSAPMLKSYPSVGTREIFYDSVTDLLVQNPISLQF